MIEVDLIDEGGVDTIDVADDLFGPAPRPQFAAQHGRQGSEAGDVGEERCPVHAVGQLLPGVQGGAPIEREKAENRFID